MSVYQEFWASLEARDWDRFGATVTDDVTASWPQSRERVTGRVALVRFMAEFPGDWHLAVEEEHADAAGAATRVAFTTGTSRGTETVPGLTFFTAGNGGRIAAIVEFWPEPYEPPAGREHLVDRY